MNETVRERFYHLLPAVYRARDLAQGQPLRALMAVLESEYQALEDDIQATYDNWFIDTCDLWVVPYLADLLGIGDLAHDRHLLASQRRRVANTLAYRRRKGTAATLEQVARDVTGWEVRAVEFFRQVATTQHLASPRPRAGRGLDLHQDRLPLVIEGPFDDAARTLDLRDNDLERDDRWPDPTRRQVRYNLGNVGLFFWRLRPYPLNRGYARHLGDGRAGCFTFDVTGRDTPLFNRPQAAASGRQQAQAHELPIPLTRALLAADLAACAGQHAAGGTVPPQDQQPPRNSTYYGPERGLCVWHRGQPDPVSPLDLVSADLSDWQAPLAPDRSDGRAMAVDVELGRLMVMGQDPAAGTGDLIVSYAYGFGADMGGGAYPRQVSLAPLDDLPAHAFRVSVAEGGCTDAEVSYRDLVRGNGRAGSEPKRPMGTLQKALALWRDYCQDWAPVADPDEQPVGVITILDSGLYGGRSHDLDTADLVIPLPRGAHLSIVAADGTRPTIRPSQRLAIRLETIPVRAMVGAGTLAILPGRRLELNGLRIDGGPVEVEAGAGSLGEAADLIIDHCTLMPGGLRVDLPAQQARALQVQIRHSILGPVVLPAEVHALEIADSIVDHAGRGLALEGPRTTLERVTVLGETCLYHLELAADTILDGPVTIAGSEPGHLRRTFAPTPLPPAIRREHAPGDLALADRANALGVEIHQLQAGETARLQAAIRPVFVSTDYGHPAYGQLAPHCPAEIRSGGDGGGEMGAFHSLHNPQRGENLRRILEEYLPLGQQVSIHFMT